MIQEKLLRYVVQRTRVVTVWFQEALNNQTIWHITQARHSSTVHSWTVLHQILLQGVGCCYMVAKPLWVCYFRSTPLNGQELDLGNIVCGQPYTYIYIYIIDVDIHQCRAGERWQSKWRRSASSATVSYYLGSSLLPPSLFWPYITPPPFTRESALSALYIHSQGLFPPAKSTSMNIYIYINVSTYTDTLLICCYICL